MEKNNTIDLGSGKVFNLLWKLAIPAITAQIINILYNMVDRMFIGHIPEIGVTALTGVGVTFPIIMLISAFSALIGMGGAPRAAIEMGKSNKVGAEEILGGCTAALLVISVILTAFFLYFQEPLLLFFGASESTLPYATQYLTIYACGTLFVQMALGLNSFITAQGFARTSMLTVLIGAITNIILDPILIFGLHMGVAGAAWATIISQGISAVWVVVFLSGNKTSLKIKRKNLRLHPRIILPVLALGVSPFIMQSTESLLTICLNTSLQKFGGDLAVGAMTILTSVMQFSLLPVMGLCQGAQPIISYNFGAKNVDRISQTVKILIISAFVYSFSLWLLIMIAPKLFVGIFTSSPELIPLASWALRIFMSVSCLMGLQIACQQSFLALGQAKISMFLALLRKIFLLIPLIYILPMFIENKVLAVYLAEPVADIIAIATTVVMFRLQFKKIMADVKESAMP